MLEVKMVLTISQHSSDKSATTKRGTMDGINTYRFIFSDSVSCAIMSAWVTLS
jgi:hypothetical protein